MCGAASSMSKVTSSLASVVMIANVRIQSPEAGSFQFSHMPAMPNGGQQLAGKLDNAAGPESQLRGRLPGWPVAFRER
jgi:hypothetical protein